MTDGPAHLACPCCNGYAVERLYLAQLDLDACACTQCGARWDEERSSGRVRRHRTRHSVLIADA